MLRQALASIRALEGAEYAFEILVGDNGSAPETRSVVDEFGATYIKVVRTGAGAARNASLFAATGDYLAFLDDDDVWLPTHLKRHFEVLDSSPDVEAVISQVIYTDPVLAPLGAPFPAENPGQGDQLLRRMLSGYFPQIGSVIARASVRQEIGGFDEALLGGQDLDWLLRIARRRTLEFVPTPALLFRGRSNGTYDALQLRRVNFDRTVFFRHSIPEWRLWRSPLAYSKAYKGTLIHFFDYFAEASVSRAKSGDRAGAWRAILSAFRVFPLRTAYHLVAPRALRMAAFTSLAPRRRNSSAQSVGEKIP
jgi:glycosyltransferase involved in cell wall biosynthesis